MLDNGPFDHVIEAIAAKRADGPTAREIIYLEPDPGTAAAPPAGKQPEDGEPTFVRTVMASRTTIPWNNSMTGVLDELQSLNAVIAEVGAIVEALQPAVLARLEAAAPVAAALRGAAAYAAVTLSSGEVTAAARQLTGDLGYGTYGRLRVQAVAESFGVTVAAELGFPADSNRSSFVTAVLSAWGRQQHSWVTADPALLEEQLGPVDVPFRLRRAELVLQGINELFAESGGGRHGDLAAMKRACWDLICDLRTKQQLVAAAVRDEALALFGPQALSADAYLNNPDDFARARTQDLTRLYEACLQAVTRTGVKGTSQDLWTALADRTQGWDPGKRAGLLARYVGFPVWDALIFPVISLSQLPQLTPITVHRFSPVDATCLHAVDGHGKAKPQPAAKLEGVSYGHFGAFFEKAWRENDYLWGRLDGAELVLRLLSRQSGSDLDLTGHLKSALTAILDAEKQPLTQIDPVWQALKEQVTQIQAGRIGPAGPAPR